MLMSPPKKRKNLEAEKHSPPDLREWCINSQTQETEMTTKKMVSNFGITRFLKTKDKKKNCKRCCRGNVSLYKEKEIRISKDFSTE